MNTSGKRLVCTIGIPVVFALASSGCATKSYVRQQLDTANQRIAQMETHTNEQLAAYAEKHQAAMASLDQRASAAATQTDDLSRRAQAANAKATQSLKEAQRNQQNIQRNRSSLPSDQFSVAQTGNVTFDLSQTELTPEAKVALDHIIQNVKTVQNPVIEVEGWADEAGSEQFNVTLSKTRADAVANYLVSNGVPLGNIRSIGRGNEQSPEELRSDFQAVAGNASANDLNMLARRVRVRVYVPNTSAQ